jgi:hypothetical protein
VVAVPKKDVLWGKEVGVTGEGMRACGWMTSVSGLFKNMRINPLSDSKLGYERKEDSRCSLNMR